MNSLIRAALAVTCFLLVGVARPAEAVIINYTVPLLGTNEVSPAGDPDGFGTALLTIDTSTVPNPSISWNITVFNISAVVDDHIHQAPAGVNGAIVVPFGGLLVGGPLQDADLNAVIANPAGFYVNIHSSEFTAGAIRGQVPEPATALMLAAGLLGLAFSSRPRAR